MTITATPNLRRLFIPDPGYILVDADLEKADAQVVAWEAGDEKLKADFRAGRNIHIENAKDIFGVSNVQKSSNPDSYYHKAKQGVHLVNYAGGYKTLMRAIGCTAKEAKSFIATWFEQHPAIKDWHEKVMQDLQLKRSVENRFGFRRFYFDRINEHLLKEALAWLPQSSVGLVTQMGVVNIHKNLPEVQILMQVHDSIVMQIPNNRLNLLPQIKKQMEITIPYDDPLVIPVGVETSTISWGDLEAVAV